MKIRPSLEELEPRDNPSNLDVFLDFSFAGTTWIPTEMRYSNKDYPRRRNPYDLNRDGRANLKDYRLLVPQMVQALERLLPEPMTVHAVDVFGDQGVGETILHAGAGYVVRVGGYTRDGATGQAWVAQPGENVAGSAFVFSGAVMDATARLKPWQRINALATVAAHEWGHLVGLPHSVYRETDIMNPFLQAGTQQTFQPEHQAEISRSFAEPFGFVDYGPLESRFGSLRRRRRPRKGRRRPAPQPAVEAVPPVPAPVVTAPVAAAVPPPAALAPPAVLQIPTRLVVFPDVVQLPIGGQHQFTAQIVDQFNKPLAVQPPATWTLTEGSGMLSSTGLYRASPYWSGHMVGRVEMGSFSADIHVLPLDLIGPLPSVEYDLRASTVHFRGTVLNDHVSATLSPDGNSATFAMSSVDAAGTIWFRRSFVLALNAPLYSVALITFQGNGGADTVFNNTGIPLVNL